MNVNVMGKDLHITLTPYGTVRVYYFARLWCMVQVPRAGQLYAACQWEKIAERAADQDSVFFAWLVK